MSSTRLDNGLTVLSHTMAHLETASLGLWIRAGARSEAREVNGIAHLVEHMAFKGTTTRSARQIAEQIEAAGGEMNAATGMETTAYYARVLKQDVALGVDILSDILINPRFETVELERECEVILQEIAAARDTPDDVAFDLMHEAAFPSQPLGRPILGHAAIVSAFTPDHIAAWRAQQYSPDRMVFAAAGAIDHKRFAEQVTRAFGQRKPFTVADWPAAQFEGGVRHERKPLGQAHIVMGFKAPGYCSEDIYALRVLSGLLGGGMSSRLFQEVREKRGLCYTISSFASAFHDLGLLCVYAATGAKRVGELIAVIADELLAMTAKVGEKEVTRAKAQLKAAFVACLESSSARAGQMAHQQLAFGKVLPVEELIAKVDAVDAEAVRALGERMLRGQKLAFSAVGALDDLPAYDAIARRFM